MMPGGDDGLDDFFARIGRPRKPGEPAPEPFARPADVEQIEAATVSPGSIERLPIPCSGGIRPYWTINSYAMKNRSSAYPVPRGRQK